MGLTMIIQRHSFDQYRCDTIKSKHFDSVSTPDLVYMFKLKAVLCCARQYETEHGVCMRAQSSRELKAHSTYSIHYICSESCLRELPFHLNTTNSVCPDRQIHIYSVHIHATQRSTNATIAIANSEFNEIEKTWKRNERGEGTNEEKKTVITQRFVV